MVTKVTPGFVLIDVPGLISGAAEGKGLGNEFLRHVMKARVWSLAFDCSAYEEGMRMLIQLLDEISLYLETVVYAHKQISQQLIRQDGKVVWQVQDTITKQILLEKMCVMLGNKIDLVPDLEIREELLTTIIRMVADHPRVTILPTQLKTSFFLLSA